MLIAAIATLVIGGPPAISPKEVFAKFKSLAGEWEGTEQDGRKERITMSVIANGSVLMEQSWFEAHPGEMMVTMYQLDGSKMTLTHYCVARNQPHLEAGDLSVDGKEIVFHYKSGGNIANRNVGHMDKVKIRFKSPDAFSSQWTWFQAGKEQWLEEFTYRRVPPGHR